MCISPPEFEHFFIVHLMNFMQASTCLLLWWWYDDDTACLMLRLLQKLLNFSETKLLPASDINLHGIPYVANTVITVVMRLLITPQFSLLLGICCGSLQHTNKFCYSARIHLLLTLSMASVVYYGVLSFPWASSAGTQGTCYNFLHDFLCCY